MAKIVTITNPLTGQPTQVDQLEHTAQQIDDAIARALPGGAIDIAFAKKANKDTVVNPWINDNGYFGNPVDQRHGYVVSPGTPYFQSDYSTQLGTTDKYYKLNVLGYNSGRAYGTIDVNGVTGYIGDQHSIRGYTSDGYTVDRWYNIGNIVLIENGELRLINNVSYNSAYRQVLLLDQYKGKQIVVSCRTDNAEISIQLYIGYGVNNNLVTFGETKTDNGVVYSYGTVPSDTVAPYLIIGITVPVGKEVFANAVKLELGNQQTLAHRDSSSNWVLNEIPDYGEQLLRCQRYFQTFATESLRPTDALDFRPVMRANPALSTITVGGKTLYTASADL